MNKKIQLMLEALKKNAALAPMAGYTDMVLRLLCHESGAAYCVSEMVSAKGYVLMPNARRGVLDILERLPQERILGLQLFGGEPEMLARAAQKILYEKNRKFDFIDINMSCPARKITSNGEGSALMLQPELAEQCVRRLKAAVSVPVTVKLRLGYDSTDEIIDFARRMECAGADMLTIHGRTTRQQFSGAANWEQIARVKQLVHIPVIGNGDISSAEEYHAAAKYNCDGIMIGRGAIGNPRIFDDIARGKAGLPPKKDLSGKIDIALRHLDMLTAWKGDSLGVREMRKHFSHYFKGMRNSTQLRTEILAINDAWQLRDKILAWRKAVQGE